MKVWINPGAKSITIKWEMIASITHIDIADTKHNDVLIFAIFFKNQKLLLLKQQQQQQQLQQQQQQPAFRLAYF